MSSEEYFLGEKTLRRLSWAYDALRRTGRGKHVGGYSYYHVLVVVGIPEANSVFEQALSKCYRSGIEYNAVKLNRRSRLSFLMYEDFSADFPALKSSLSLNLEAGTNRIIDYSQRTNPPILHRKELLLPADDPRVSRAARLTQKLEELGAFRSAKEIGTRSGWAVRLASFGISIEEGVLKVEACPQR